MSRQRDTCLYFITDARRRYVKIGLSCNVGARLHDLQAGSPLVLKIDLIVENGAREIEERLHCCYAKHWRHREWFNYPPELKRIVDAAKEAGHIDLTTFPAVPMREDEGGALLRRYSLLAALSREAIAS